MSDLAVFNLFVFDIYNLMAIDVIINKCNLQISSNKNVEMFILSFISILI